MYLNDIYAVGIENSNKPLYEFKDILNKSVIEYEKYNITQRQVIEKLTYYNELADNNSLSKK